MKRHYTLITIGAAAAVFAVVFILPKARDGLPPRANAQSPSPSAAPTAAATAPAAAQPPAVLTLPGTLTADEAVELYAKASGYVSEINVDIGSRVRKGDVIVRLDVPELLDDLRQNEAVVAARRAKAEAMRAKAAQAKLAIESAQAQLKRVEAELNLSRITQERKAQLYREKAIPEQEFDVADSQLAITQADLAIARANVENAKGEESAARADVQAAEADIAVAAADHARLKTLIEYTTIKAPFDGVVTRREVDHGAFVRSAAQGAGSPLLAVEKVDRLRLVIDVPETHAPLVQIGTEVAIQFRAGDGQPPAARVTRTAVALRPDTRTMRAEIDLENADGKLLPGMYAKVSITLPRATPKPSGEQS